MDDRPCFYNIIHPGFLHHKPKIPQAFIMHITSGKATLKCSSGRRWPIKLLRTRDSVILADGWKEYATAHSLQEKDLLLFTCDKNMCFEVRIYDPSGLERVEDDCWIQPVNLDHHSSAFRQDKRDKLEEHREKDVYEVTKREEMFMPNARTSNQNVKSPQREETYLPYERMRNHRVKSGKKDLEDSRLDAFEFTDSGEENSMPYESIRRKKVKSGKKVREFSEEDIYEATKREDVARPNTKIGTRKVEPEVKDIFVVEVESEDNEKTRYQKGKKTKKDVTKEAGSSSGKGISRTSESFRSKFPFFVKHLKEYNVDKHFILGVPTGFAKKHLPSEKTELTLWNPEGKRWRVILNQSANQTSLGGGWKSYATDNNLRQGQCCVFELVDDLELLVHTFSSWN